MMMLNLGTKNERPKSSYEACRQPTGNDMDVLFSPDAVSARVDQIKVCPLAALPFLLAG